MDAADILAQEFPDNVSISDLCDCGHCKRKHPKHGSGPMQKPHTGPFPETDYGSTFKAVQHPRPRSSKKPPRSPGVRERNPYKMVFDTNQRDAYLDPKVKGRTQMIVPEENYMPSSVPMETKTSYTNEFKAKELPAEMVRYAEPRGNYITTSAAFDGQTTNKDHFKQWVAQPSLSFQELPSFTGSILYPEKSKMPQSITKTSFKGKFGKRPDAVKFPDNNIGIDGDLCMETTHNNTYKNIRGDHRSVQIVNEPTLKVNKKFGAFQSETQSRRDFGEYKNGLPPRAQAAEPAPTTIDLKFDNKRAFDTEQRTIYKGHDVTTIPTQKPIRHDLDEYIPPTEKFETMTSNKRDYIPLKVPANYVRRASMPNTMYVPKEIAFDARTSFNEFYKNWGTKKRVRYGDFHENRRVEPVAKFEGQSVTKKSFTPKEWSETKDFKPADNAISKEGNIDFGTMYRETFQKPEVKPCRAQVYLAQKELKRQRAKAIASH